jgi:hypothetical protein
MMAIQSSIQYTFNKPSRGISTNMFAEEIARIRKLGVQGVSCLPTT